MPFLREHLADQGLTYMTVDGAGGEKEHTSDFTVIQVWSTQMDETLVLLDARRDRLDPKSRIELAMELYQRWAPYRFQNCRWESYGMDSDIFWMKELQAKTSNYFEILTVAGVQKSAKKKRIEGRVLPAFKGGRVLLPDTLMVPCQYLGGGDIDYVQHFTGQALAYPLVEYDDDLDCMSRMFEPDHPLMYPRRARKRTHKDAYERAYEERTATEPDAVAPWV